VESVSPSGIEAVVVDACWREFSQYERLSWITRVVLLRTTIYHGGCFGAGNYKWQYILIAAFSSLILTWTFMITTLSNGDCYWHRVRGLSVARCATGEVDWKNTRIRCYVGGLFTSTTETLTTRQTDRQTAGVWRPADSLPPSTIVSQQQSDAADGVARKSIRLRDSITAVYFPGNGLPMSVAFHPRRRRLSATSPQ